MHPHLQFQVPKLRQKIQLIGAFAVRATLAPLRLEILEPDEPRFDPPPDNGPWRPLAVGDPWGVKQGWASFRAAFEVPRDWTGGRVDLHLRHDAAYLERPADDAFPAGPEGQVFLDGQRLGAIDAAHHRIRLESQPGARHDVRAVFFAGRAACRHRLRAFCLAWVDPEAESLFHDLRVALEVAELLDERSAQRTQLLEAIAAAVRACDLREALGELEIPQADRRDPDGRRFRASVPAAREALRRGLAAVAPGPAMPPVVAVGHAHIDLAWLWPIRQTRHKCVRTFATQARLLDQHPAWVFQQSSPQAYAWVEEDAPDLFERIRTHVAAGRWEAEGAMWVEADTNLPSGESLVRQLLLGKRFLRERLGVDSRLLWLPDVFGFSAALPQIMRLAGVDLFVTSKISWNQFNRFPHDTFRWRGLDGSEVTAHFITAALPGERIATYNARATPAEVKSAWDEHRQRHLRVEPLMTFGHGDGGGGPTEEMLETLARLAAMPQMGGVPRVRFGRARDLLERIAARAEELPVWEGELYLELHRGTYTTQAWIKRANRKSEIRLHTLEWLASLAQRVGHRVDRARLEGLWRDLLLMQFHDILPGSSVGEVYEETRAMHARLASEADAMIAAAADALAAAIDTSGAERPLVLFNTLSWDRHDPLCLPDGTWIDGVAVPAGGWTVIDAARRPVATDALAPTVSEDGRALENQFWRLRIDAQGRLAEVFDKRAQRQVLAPGEVGNAWQVFQDRPLDWDAWDIDLDATDEPLPGPVLADLRAVERGPVRAAVELTWHLPPPVRGERSTITQRIVLWARQPRIDFETRIDWHEHHQLLKVAFPVNVRAAEVACQIQFGHVFRPTHRNTSWDVARFEVCAHQFIDLSEHGYGVALLNDCKHGHDVRGNVMRLTCIKCPLSPHARADQGLHEFTYALLPHAGSFQEAGVIRAAAELNTPVTVRGALPARGPLPATWRFVTSDNPAVVIDTLKPAEDGDGLILRLHESFGGRGPVRLRFADPPRLLHLVDLLEQRLDGDVDLTPTGDEVSLRVRPFEIVSLRLRW